MPRHRRALAVQQVPLSIWRSLYEVADELRRLELWEELDDKQPLGADHPRTGEPMLGVIMGSLGQVFGLALHLGADAVRFAVKAAQGEMDDEPDMEEFHSIWTLKVEFVPKKELTSGEKRLINELNFRPEPARPLVWPSFQSLRPGYVPWHLDLAEAEVLLHALPRLVRLGTAVRGFYGETDDCLADGFAFWPAGRALEEPLRAEEIDWRRLSVPPRPEPPSVAVEEAVKVSLKRLPLSPRLTLEVDASSGLGVIDEGDRPWLMKMGSVAETQSGAILATDLAEGPAEPIEALAGRVFVQALQRSQLRPATVRVRQARIQTALKQICDCLGMRLELRRELPAVAAFREAMAARFA